MGKPNESEASGVAGARSDGANTGIPLTDASAPAPPDRVNSRCGMGLWTANSGAAARAGVVFFARCLARLAGSRVSVADCDPMARSGDKALTLLLPSNAQRRAPRLSPCVIH